MLNTFPVPLLTEQNKADLTTCAESILTKMTAEVAKKAPAKKVVRKKA